MHPLVSTHIYFVPDRTGGIAALGCEVLAAQMPILRKESDLFPADLFDIPIEKAPWEIVHLRSRREKAVARILLDAEMPFFLPQIEQKKKANGRTFVSHLPLFAGYIFVRSVPGMRETLWRTNSVANMLEVPDQEQLMCELQQIHELQESGAELTPRPEIVTGDAVRIEEGAFAGYMGVVIQERGSLRLIVSVSMLKKSVSVEFPRESLSHAKHEEVPIQASTLKQ